MDDPPIERWHVVFPARDGGEAMPETVLKQFPAAMDPKPIFTGYGEELHLALIRLTVKAYTEREARQTATEAMARACTAVGWTKIPEIRRISKA